MRDSRQSGCSRHRRADMLGWRAQGPTGHATFQTSWKQPSGRLILSEQRQNWPMMLALHSPSSMVHWEGDNPLLQCSQLLHLTSPDHLSGSEISTSATDLHQQIIKSPFFVFLWLKKTNYTQKTILGEYLKDTRWRDKSRTLGLVTPEWLRAKLGGKVIISASLVQLLFILCRVLCCQWGSLCAFPPGSSVDLQPLAGSKDTGKKAGVKTLGFCSRTWNNLICSAVQWVNEEEFNTCWIRATHIVQCCKMYVSHYMRSEWNYMLGQKKCKYLKQKLMIVLKIINRELSH